MFSVCFFFNDTATTEIYTLSLHDALPIWKLWKTGGEKRPSRPRKPSMVKTKSRTASSGAARRSRSASRRSTRSMTSWSSACRARSEEHTSELQSRQYLVCRLLLEKKKHHL